MKKTTYFIILGIATLYFHLAKANVAVDWELQGDDLHYTITSATYSPGGNKDMNCGILGGKCFVQMGLSSSPFQDVQWKDYVSLRGSQTFSAVAQAWNAKYMPRSGVIYNWITINSIKPRCINLYISSDIAGAAYMGNSCTGTMNPPPVVPPIPPLSCDIDGSINLAHGVLSNNSLNGNTKFINSLVHCTRAASVKIIVIANQGGDVVKLRSDGSLNSQLKVNGVNGLSGVTLSVPGPGGINVQFSSTLVTNGEVSPGDFSGSAVALLTIL